MIIGVHPWVYAAQQPGHDLTPVLDRVFADAGAAGFDGIELMHTALLPDDAEGRIGALSERHGLRVIGSSFGAALWDREAHRGVLEDAQRIVPRLARLGGSTLGTSVGRPPGGPSRPLKTPQQLDAQADALRRLMALCEAHGVVLNLHNHTYEVEDGEHDLRGTLARVPDVKLGPDLNWLLRAGVDPVGFVRRYGDRIVFVHLRDQDAGGRWTEALGEGSMDHVAIGQALRDIGFAGPAVVELAHEPGFVPARPIRDSLRLSCQFARRVLAPGPGSTGSATRDADGPRTGSGRAGSPVLPAGPPRPPDRSTPA